MSDLRKPEQVKDLLRRARNLLAQPASWWKQSADSRSRLISELDCALAQPEPTRSQQMRDAGYTRRPRQLPKEDEQEPVAWMTPGKELHLANEEGFRFSDWTPLYTAPPQRKPLTPEEILLVFDSNNVYGSKWVEFVRSIEKAHGIGGEE